jgi:dTDP-4-dehydrorhamnose 3,5-epimerase
LNHTDILVEKLSIIENEGGDILHLLKSSDNGFMGFGEAYLSWIKPGKVKAWKMHEIMHMNLIVPVGRVAFIFYIESKQQFHKQIIGHNIYNRISVPPGIWFGFKGCSDKKSMVINIADIHHSPDEQKRRPINHFLFNWDDV